MFSRIISNKTTPFNCRAPSEIMHSATALVGSISITGDNGKTIKESGLTAAAPGDYVIAVFIVVREFQSVVIIQVTAENRLVYFDISGIGIRLADTGIASLDIDTVYELKRSCPITGSDPAALIRSIGSFGYTDFIAIYGNRQGILQVSIGIGPTRAVISTWGIFVHIQKCLVTFYC